MAIYHIIPSLSKPAASHAARARGRSGFTSIEIPTSDTRGRPRRGVTLFEISIVMTLAGLMVGMAVPRIHAFRNSASLEGAAYELARDLGRARMEAIKRNQKVTFTRLADTAYQVGDEHPRRLPPGVSFKEASAESVTLTSTGLAADGNSQFRLKAASHSRAVVIRGSGHVSVQ